MLIRRDPCIEIPIVSSEGVTQPGTTGIQRQGDWGSDPNALVRFRQWMVEHRGATLSTVQTYVWPLRRLFGTLGEDPGQYEIEGLQRFLSDYSSGRAPRAAAKARISVRLLLRFLAAEGRCPEGLEDRVIDPGCQRIEPQRLRQGLLGPFVESFLGRLQRDGFARRTVVLYVANAARFNRWVTAACLSLEQLDESVVTTYLEHRRRSTGSISLRPFLKYLRAPGVAVLPSCSTQTAELQPVLLHEFGRWMTQHRGVAQATIERYGRVLRGLLDERGDDPSRYGARDLVEFLLGEQRRRPKNAPSVVGAMRAFLRFLSAEGRCAPGLDAAIPSAASWRLAALPRYLSAEQVERVLAACDTSTPGGLRDRATLLLLARLALRAGDVAQLRLGDLDWTTGSLRLQGKGRRQARLPLTQEIGDALLAYLDRGRPCAPYDHVFLGTRPPIRPWGRASVSALVAKYLRRAGVTNPCPGKQVLRHSAATEMLRHGSSLQEIAAVLRHRSCNTTTVYAKVDVALLKLVAQPWPEVTSC